MHYAKNASNSSAVDCYHYFSDHYFSHGFYVANPAGAFITAGAPSASVVNLRTGEVMRVIDQGDLEFAAAEIVALVKEAANP